MSIFGQYTIVETINAGPDTILCRGHHTENRAPVALKLPRRAPPTARDIARLQHEHAILRDVAAPGVVKAYELASHGEDLALVLESLPGQPLDVLLRAGRLAPREALAIAAEVADILACVHARGVTHKDIKPANIVVVRAPLTVVLVDFGLATRLSLETQRPGNPDALEGTLAYISPEQTGRMNRALDLRSDLYSLGATLYHMLVGAPPFHSDDLLELVHSHIARVPNPPRQLAPELPESVSALVMKLLAKAPEDRYQSAAGLAADLRECLRQLDTTGTVEHFPLGRHEATVALRLPQKLYGRAEELGTLLDAFERARLGATELLLIAGYSGIGKSALVHEIHKKIAHHGGTFIAGKFDQLARNAPYAPFVQAFRDLIRQTLGERGDHLYRVRDELLRAADGNAQVLVDLIPELALLIGPQPPVAVLGPTESLNRFNRLIDGFVQVFAGGDAPLVLFLDDLQWTDLASLKLLQLLLTSPNPRRLLVIAAYRDSEVGPAHPLVVAAEELRGGGVPVHDVRLGPLAPQHLAELLADALMCPQDQVDPLARAVWRKTAGNPFFVGQFLRGLYQDGLLHPGAGAQAFTWDLAAIEGCEVTTNVADFMDQRLRRCAPATLRALRLAACVGHRFTLTALSTICDESPETTAAALWEALEEGLVLPESVDYRFLHHATPTQPGLGERLGLSYRFSHDRVQQAMYALIEPDRRADTHLRIGRLLLARMGDDPPPDELFDVVDHLNIGQGLLTDPAERRRLSALDLAVGRRAKGSTAYAAAARYLRAGLALLSEGAWDDDYDHTYALHCELAECEYLAGAFDEAETLFERIHARARSAVDRAQVYILQMRLYNVAGRYDAGVELGAAGLALFDVELPADDEALQAAIAAEAAAIPRSLAGRPVAALLDAPLMRDPAHRAILALMVGLMPCAYIGRPKVFPYFGLKAVNFSLRHGNAEESCFAYSVYGFMLVAVFGDAASGYAFSEMSIALNERLGDTKLRGTLLHLHGDHINFWRHPLRTDFPILEQAFHACVSAGDLVYASFLAFETVWQYIEVGDPLSEARRVAERFAAFARDNKNDAVHQTIRLQQQFLDSLAGRTRPGTLLDGDDFDAQECIGRVTRASFGCGIAFYHIIRLILLYTFGRHEEALVAAASAREVLGAVMAMPIEATFHVYEALALCARARDVELAQAQADRAVLRGHIEKLARWASDSPENFEHKYLLVRAEEARIDGRPLEAEELYDQAIASARRHGFVQYEALASELCGAFYRERQRTIIAPVYMRAAYYGYMQWGAPAKAALIAREFPQLTAGATPGGVSQTVDKDEDTSPGLSARAALDMATVVRLGQALVGEIELDKLLEKLMRIVMQNAGGTRVCLVLDRDGALELAATASADDDRVEILAGTSLAAHPDIPASVVHYVARTHEPVVLGDVAREPRFAADPALAPGHVKSLLCLALVHRRRVSGILYVENQLIRDAFSHTEVLHVLASQAAIAIDNARLYTMLADANRALEQRVIERTAELTRTLDHLQTAQRQLVEAEKMAALGTLVAGIAHEIKNPLNFVNNFAELSLEFADELARQLPECADAPAASQRGELLAELAGNLKRIREHGRRADEIINSMLMHARERPGEVVADLNALVTTHVALAYQGFRAGDRSFGAELVEDLGPGLDGVPLAYQELARVIVNLVSNACHALRERARQAEPGYRPMLRVTTRRKVDGALIHVRDNGTGIPAELQRRIFDPFFTTKSPGEGTGLGLSMTFDIVVSQLGGKLDVASVPGEYAEFTVWIPLPDATT